MPKTADPLLSRAIVAWIACGRNLREAPVAGLARQGYHVAPAPDIASFSRAAAAVRPEILVLDMDGLAADPRRVVQRLRRTSAAAGIPIIFLSSPGADAAQCLQAGADDHILKPVPVPVLCARLDAAIETRRRLRPPGPWSPGALRSRDGRLVLDLKAFECRVQAGLEYEPVRLTRREFMLLARLLRRANRVVGWRDLYRTGWRPRRLRLRSRTLVQHVLHLRRKLAGIGRGIEAVPGIGYRLND